MLDETCGITFRLRGFLGGSGTAITSPSALLVPIDRLELWKLLRDAALEIDRLEAELATARNLS